jgi:hypothetical protein
MDRPPVPRSFPNETSPEVKEKVIALSVSHPAWGRKRISDHLRLGHRGDVVSQCDLYRRKEERSGAPNNEHWETTSPPAPHSSRDIHIDRPQLYDINLMLMQTRKNLSRPNVFVSMLLRPQYMRRIYA